MYSEEMVTILKNLCMSLIEVLLNQIICKINNLKKKKRNMDIESIKLIGQQSTYNVTKNTNRE